MFVAVLLTFLVQCVDYGKIRGSQKLPEIMVPQCTRNMSGLWNLGLWMFAFYFIWKLVQYLLDIRRLLNIRDFYLYMLEIPDDDMQTVTWQEVVARVMTLRDQNIKTAGNLTRDQRQFLGSQSKERLDASDIANRLMRRENYMIALFNKDILDLTIPLPFLQNHQLLSRTLEWTLEFSILDLVFDEQGQVNQQFLKADRRGELSMKLRSRFFFSGVMILIMSPFVVGYLMVVYFLTYFYVRTPAAHLRGLELTTKIAGGPEEPRRLVGAELHAPCGVEVQGVQRAATSLPKAAGHVAPLCVALHGPVPKGQS